MKIQINKEFLILFVIFAALPVYLSFQRTDRLHYELPRLDALDPGAITSLEIAFDSRSVALSVRDGSWRIEPQGYPADPAKVHRMLSAITALSLTDLASESGSLERYGFGGQEKITVQGLPRMARFSGPSTWQGASTYRTPRMLPGDSRVFRPGGACARFRPVGRDLRTPRCFPGSIPGYEDHVATPDKESVLPHRDRTRGRGDGMHRPERPLMDSAEGGGLLGSRFAALGAEGPPLQGVPRETAAGSRMRRRSPLPCRTAGTTGFHCTRPGTAVRPPPRRLPPPRSSCRTTRARALKRRPGSSWDSKRTDHRTVAGLERARF